jgi:hypothetical protein
MYDRRWDIPRCSGRENANCQVPNLRKDGTLHTLHAKRPYYRVWGHSRMSLPGPSLWHPRVTFHCNRNLSLVSLASVHVRVMCSFVSQISTLRSSSTLIYPEKQLEADSRVVCSAFFVLTRPWPLPLLPRSRLLRASSKTPSIPSTLPL